MGRRGQEREYWEWQLKLRAIWRVTYKPNKAKIPKIYSTMKATKMKLPNNGEFRVSNC